MPRERRTSEANARREVGRINYITFLNGAAGSEGGRSVSAHRKQATSRLVHAASRAARRHVVIKRVRRRMDARKPREAKLIAFAASRSRSSRELHRVTSKSSPMTDERPPAIRKGVCGIFRLEAADARGGGAEDMVLRAETREACNLSASRARECSRAFLLEMN